MGHGNFKRGRPKKKFPLKHSPPKKQRNKVWFLNLLKQMFENARIKYQYHMKPYLWYLRPRIHLHKLSKKMIWQIQNVSVTKCKQHNSYYVYTRDNFYTFKYNTESSKMLILKTWQNISIYTKQVKRYSWRFQFWHLQEHFEKNRFHCLFKKKMKSVIWKR